MTCTSPDTCTCRSIVDRDRCACLESEFTHLGDDDCWVCNDCDLCARDCECEHRCGVESDEDRAAEAADEEAYRRSVCLAAFGTTY